jgi:hypothetical protein
MAAGRLERREYAATGSTASELSMPGHNAMQSETLRDGELVKYYDDRGRVAYIIEHEEDEWVLRRAVYQRAGARGPLKPGRPQKPHWRRLGTFPSLDVAQQAQASDRSAPQR